MTQTATSDLIAIIKDDINMSNVTSLTVRPKVILDSEEVEDDSAGTEASGILQMLTETYEGELENTKNLSDETYTIEATFHMDAQTTVINFQQILQEFKRLLRVENFNTAKLYHYSIRITAKSNVYTPVAFITFTLIREDVDQTT